VVGNKKIIFFDGVCNLCNSSVNFIIKRDPSHKFLFASLQGETAKKLLSIEELISLKTIIYYDHGVKYFESTAALKIAAQLSGAWQGVRLFLLIPAFLRNLVYRFISRNRYRWFGRLESCRLPLQKDKNRFLE
jgi:predicted DCC family thiol-disulfide oxidoreductase YuxK